eukprot:CAMPEP_0113229718 /NCGR_PEP_ID=MMETSP0008_2-20120614/499_1 /TAXON_ID=97485 /ORGANISM="Prymnesium parvum" /LENGTH=187 /DNA_ID=CAMNT_0000076251 /DNA_START=111 /DNA_END=676 /DNA_ORIENTATION=+ /assembly_acc=CAM_ASM_000153
MALATMRYRDRHRLLYGWLKRLDGIEPVIKGLLGGTVGLSQPAGNRLRARSQIHVLRSSESTSSSSSAPPETPSPSSLKLAASLAADSSSYTSSSTASSAVTASPPTSPLRCARLPIVCDWRSTAFAAPPLRRRFAVLLRFASATASSNPFAQLSFVVLLSSILSCLFLKLCVIRANGIWVLCDDFL